MQSTEEDKVQNAAPESEAPEQANAEVPEGETLEGEVLEAETTVEPAAPDEVATGQPEDADMAEADPSSPEDLGRLLEDTRAKADEHYDQLVRARAELDNLRKRHERDLASAHKFALDKFVAELLSVWDSLELGHKAAQEETADIEKLREGTELTLKLLGDVLGKFGVEPVDPEGQPFNPELHQAMSMLPRDDVPPNTVINVFQKGFTLNGRLVRPAMVVVSSAG